MPFQDLFILYNKWLWRLMPQERNMICLQIQAYHYLYTCEYFFKILNVYCIYVHVYSYFLPLSDINRQLRKWACVIDLLYTVCTVTCNILTLRSLCDVHIVIIFYSQSKSDKYHWIFKLMFGVHRWRLVG